jgi:hypothetical protein
MTAGGELTTDERKVCWGQALQLTRLGTACAEPKGWVIGTEAGLLPARLDQAAGESLVLLMTACGELICGDRKAGWGRLNNLCSRACTLQLVRCVCNYNCYIYNI